MFSQTPENFSNAVSLPLCPGKEDFKSGFWNISKMIPQFVGYSWCNKILPFYDCRNDNLHSRCFSLLPSKFIISSRLRIYQSQGRSLFFFSYCCWPIRRTRHNWVFLHANRGSGSAWLLRYKERRMIAFLMCICQFGSHTPPKGNPASEERRKMWERECVWCGKVDRRRMKGEEEQQIIFTPSLAGL